MSKIEDYIKNKFKGLTNAASAIKPRIQPALTNAFQSTFNPTSQQFKQSNQQFSNQLSSIPAIKEWKNTPSNQLSGNLYRKITGQPTQKLELPTLRRINSGVSSLGLGLMDASEKLGNTPHIGGAFKVGGISPVSGLNLVGSTLEGYGRTVNRAIDGGFTSDYAKSTPNPLKRPMDFLESDQFNDIANMADFIPGIGMMAGSVGDASKAIKATSKTAKGVGVAEDILRAGKNTDEVADMAKILKDAKNKLPNKKFDPNKLFKNKDMKDTVKPIYDKAGKIVGATAEQADDFVRSVKKPRETKIPVSNLTKTIKEATNAGVDVPVAKPYDGNIIKGVRDRSIASIEGFFRKQGDAGNKFADLYKAGREEAGYNAGRATVALDKVLKNLDDKDIAKFSSVAEGKAVADTPALQEAVNAWDIIRKDIADKAQSAGLQIKNSNGLEDFTPRENYYPHFLPEELLKDKKAQKEALVKMVKSGWAKNMAEAESKFNAYVKRKVKRRYGNLEVSREGDLPIYEMDPRKVLLSYVDSAYHRIADAKNFGSGDERAYELANQIGLDGGDGELARRMIDRVFNKEDIPAFTKNLTGALTGFQTVTKMGLSALQNSSQPIANIWVVGPKHTAQAIGDALGKNKSEARAFTMMTGEILDSSKKQLLNMAGATDGFTSEYLSKVKFSLVEENNRIITANAGRRYAEDLASKVIKNPADKATARALEYIGLDAKPIIERGSITGDELVKAGKTLIDKTQFSTEAFDLPYSWTSPWGRVITQFKSFAFKQTKFLAEQSKYSAKEARQGNFKPLANGLIAAGVAAPLYGEIVNNVRSLISNRKRDEGGVERYINNVFAAFSLGLAGDAGTLLTGKYGTQGTVSTVAGPTSSDLYQGVEAVQSLFRDRKTLTGKDEFVARVKPITRYATKKLPVAGSTLSNTFIPNNMVDSYYGVNANKDNSKPSDAYTKESDKGLKLFSFGKPEQASASDLPSDPEVLASLYEDDRNTLQNKRFKEAEIQYGDYTEEEKKAKLKELDAKTSLAASRFAEIRSRYPDIARNSSLSKYKVEEIVAMPEGSSYEKSKKEDALFTASNKMFKELDGPELENALGSLGVDRDEAERYMIASEPADVRYTYIMDALNRRNSSSAEDVMKYLAAATRPTNGKALLTSAVINDLYESGVINETQKKYLKGLKYSTDGKLLKAKSSGSSSKKVKALELKPYMSKAGSGNLSVKMPKLTAVSYADAIGNLGVPSSSADVSQAELDALRRPDVKPVNIQLKK